MKIGSAPDFVFGDVVLIFLELFFVSFKIFDHEVFADEFVVVGKVVNDLAVVESDALVVEEVPVLGLKRLRVV